MTRLTENELREDYLKGLRGERWENSAMFLILILGLTFGIITIAKGWWLSLLIIPLILIVFSIKKIRGLTTQIRENQIYPDDKSFKKQIGDLGK